MGQVTFDDEELFGEAAEEVRDDVEAALADARASLPDPDAVWSADADNVLGVLNGLRSAMDHGDADEHLREARKWYTMGERADAFDDAEQLEAEIEAVEGVVADMEDARDAVSDLAGTVPELRSALEDAHEAGTDVADDDTGDAEGSDAGESDAEESGEDDDGATDPDEADEEATADEAESGEAETEEAAADGGERQDGEQATLDADDD